MNKPALVVLVILAGCSGKKSNKKPMSGAGGCPLPAKSEIAERFAVGVAPDHRVEDAIAHGAKCHLEIVANDVVTIDGGTPKLVKPGVFEGHCPGETRNVKLEAVAPAKTMIEVNGLQTGTGELGLGKPITLDSKTPDKLVSVIAHTADSCGTPLSLGTSRWQTTWSLGDGCDKVAKLVPWGEDKKTGEEMQIAPVAPGTCTVSATLLGVKGDVIVTVK